MLKTLLKKQLMEIGSSFFRKSKNEAKNIKTTTIIFGVLYVVIYIAMAFSFFKLSQVLCEPLVSMGVEWLYFVLVITIAIILGVVGSVFNTFATLYQAKDNEMLLVMPIPPSKILMVRLAGVYILGFFFEMLVMIPALIAYYIIVDITATGIISSVLIIFAVSGFVLMLSCILGWIVAIINARLKNKNIITVIFSLGFIGAYYHFYSKATGMLEEFLTNSLEVGEQVKNAAYPIYLIGKGASGNIESAIAITMIVLVGIGIVYYVMAKNFLKLVTYGKGETKGKYVEKRHKQKSVEGALLFKEAKRFVSSSTYMLNCGLGTVLFIITIVSAFIKTEAIKEGIIELSDAGLIKETEIILIICTMVGIVSTMNDITAPSVSLEGKNIWILQTFPVDGWKVLKAKIQFHALMTIIPAVICTIVFECIVKTPVVSNVLGILFAIVLILTMGAIGLAINLKLPNLEWTNETVPVKQSMGVMVTLMGGWALIVGLVVIYIVIRDYISPVVFLLLSTIVLGLVLAMILMWIKKKGAKIFEQL